MENNVLNILIVDKNKLVAESLKKDLEKRYQSEINISVYHDEKSCLQKVNSQTDAVLLVYLPHEKNMNEQAEAGILNTMKMLNPQTKLLTHSFDGNIGSVIESFRLTNPQSKKYSAGIDKLILHYITSPIRALARELGITSFMGIFMLTFFILAAIVIIILKIVR